MDELESIPSPRFFSATEDIEENSLDLNRYLVTHKSATFYLQMESDNLVQEGIYKHDLLVVDRSLSTGKTAIAVIDGELKAYKTSLKNKILFLSNDYEQPFSLNQNDYIWGIVTAIIRKL
jgi:DNA polymerase V